MEMSDAVMDEKIGKREQLTVFLKEYDTIAEEIRIRVSRSDKIIGFGFTILGVGLTFGLKENIGEIYLLVPLGFFGIIFYAILNTTAVLALGGHKMYLSGRLNEICGGPILIWETISEEIFHRCFQLDCMYLIYLIFILISLYISLSKIYYYFGGDVFFLSCALIVALFVILIISFRKMRGTFRMSYNLSIKRSNNVEN